jgi:uncharacterized membrane protein
MDPAPWRFPALLVSSWRLLARHRVWAIGLVVCSVGLSLLAPLLQVLAKLPDTPNVELLMRFAAVLPLELYLIPRFLLALDAEALDNSTNPCASWRETFEQRWFRAFIAKMLLAICVSVGIAFFVLPGLIILLILGWMPMLVLLRGENIREAAKSSARIMAKAWPKVVQAMLYLGAAYILVFLILALILERFAPSPEVMVRLRHPLYWFAYATGAVMELILNLMLLCLYQAVESDGATSP